MTCRSAPLLYLAVSCLAGGALCGSASAQTTRPAEPVVATRAAAAPLPAPLSTSSWPRVVGHFVSNAAAGEVETAWTFMSARARIDEFDPDAPATFARLVDLAKRTTLLGVHPYETSPTTLAEDIAS